VIDQIGLFACGVTAVTLTNMRSLEVRRWAPFFGLAGEPFWLYTSWINEQWGIVMMCFIYGAAWSRGIWVTWIRP
jgi:hypothetical protein